MPLETDTVVLGAGPGGYVAAIRLGQLGVKTLIVEKQYWGGVCLNIGCIPSKALITAAKQHKAIKEAGKFGLKVTGVEIDGPALQKFKEGVVNKLASGVQALLKGNKVESLKGVGRFTGPNTMEVETEKGKETVRFKRAIVATGSRPIEIPGFKFDEERVLSSTGALALQQVPQSLVVIGGGYIGLELACMYANLGTKVTVIELLPQILTGQDAEVSKTMLRLLQKKGIEFHLEAKAKGVERTGKGVEVTFTTKDGKEQSAKGDHVLVSVGRRVNTENLGLDRAGVQLNDKGIIPVNNKLQTNIPHIFAIGDIVPGPQLAHKASKEGIVAAEVIAGKKSIMDVRAIPAAIFTDPEVAAVGRTEEQLKTEGVPYKVGKFPFAVNGRAIGAGDTDGFVKILAHKDTEEVLGVHIIGPDASDLIAEPTLGIEMGAFLDDLAMTIHTHPTLAEAVMEAAEHAQGHAIHAANR